MNLTEHPELGGIYGWPKEFPDGGIAYVMPLTFGRSRINVGNWGWVDNGY